MATELDKASILENFMDDEELLFESIDLFLERVDVRMGTLQAAVAGKDVEVSMAEAHTIKGMIGIFDTGESFKSAKCLELKGREKNTEGVDADFADLRAKLDSLLNALIEWRAS